MSAILRYFFTGDFFRTAVLFGVFLDAVFFVFAAFFFFRMRVGTPDRAARLPRPRNVSASNPSAATPPAAYKISFEMPAFTGETEGGGGG